MDLKQAGSSLDSLVSSFNTRIVELQDLVIARNMYPATSVPDLSQADTTLKAMESQIQSIKDRLQEERSAIPKAKVASPLHHLTALDSIWVYFELDFIGFILNLFLLISMFFIQKIIELSLRQQRKLQQMLANVPSGMREAMVLPEQTPSRSLIDVPNYDHPYETLELKEEPVPLPKEKKVRSSAPRWYVTSEELDSLSSYMRGRLTFDKVNIAINEIATLADANFQLITAPKKKLTEDTWEKALELRDIATAETVRGKHFFLETDIKGPGLKLDNTGKAILTVLRHLGRIQEIRIGHHRVITLAKPQ
ncbi:spindle and kinetochore-associated protein 1 homolog isoform X1 [Asparagus officinalis]|uniref:spindle and kinetochore-associated protein 1 homolog isoform X1 n=1 Tax=Asparagus officinalis TaxID=4686 RepID=UPI00098E8595|nr:spindle and kinetochore-associated protein 1 homolog isoform X1 [Asparagus officinalis]